MNKFLIAFSIFFCSLSSVLKSYGQHLKAPAAMVRLRLYETLTLLPANSLESSYTHLLRMLVAEFTLTENPANTTNSLLRELCHSDDSIILGTWLQETDHKTIEDQVRKIVKTHTFQGNIQNSRMCCHLVDHSIQTLLFVLFIMTTKNTILPCDNFQVNR